jgi:lysyl-tRNA synthetase class 2
MLMFTKFEVDAAIMRIFPDAKMGVLIGKGLDNRSPHPEIVKLLRQTEEEARKKLNIEQLAAYPKIEDWREAYRKFGFKPSAYRSSVEALLRRVLQGKELPSISPIVDLYNIVSIKHVLAAGGDDIDKVEGPIRLTFAEGSERFIMLGQTAPEQIIKGEVVYRDDNDVLCRAWNYRECDKTKISPETSNVCLVLEGLAHTSKEEVVNGLAELKKLLSTYCRGNYQELFVDKSSEHVIQTKENKGLNPVFESQEFQNRSQKLAEIRALGIDPYPAKFTPTHSAHALLHKYEGKETGHSEDAEAGKTEKVAVAGRVVLFRPMGKNAFAHVQDATGRIQLMFNRDHLHITGLPAAEQPLKFLEKKLDLGDIIGVEGNIFRTQTGELTLYVKNVTVLCKSLLPLPDKHAGLADKGTRYRKRWLDLICHLDVAETFRKRSRIVQFIRRYFENANFMEVETPILQNIYGGAEARPFTTELNALHQNMFLRISIEISLKKLIVGGMDRIFEIGKIFRNEGIDRTHNPEFTMLEAYATYWDYNDMMVFVENLYESLALDLYGTTEIAVQDKTINLKAPWKRLSMKGAIKTYGNVDVDTLSDDQIRTLLKNCDPKEIAKESRGLLIAHLFEELAEPHLIQPHHIIDHPIETTPLCKPHRDPKLRAEGFVERFESFICGTEMCNSYTELNDPELQRKLLVDQAAKRESGDEEAHPFDEEFVEAICQGMPPTGGLGIGIDRLVMLFTQTPSIRDVLYFPIMRPEE